MYLGGNRRWVPRQNTREESSQCGRDETMKSDLEKISDGHGVSPKIA